MRPPGGDRICEQDHVLSGTIRDIDHILIHDTAEDERDKNLYLFEPVRQAIRLCKKTSNTIGATRHVKA